MKFRVSDDLALGADFVTSTAGIFATKGQGKSYLAQVIAEEMLENGQVIVVFDPTDVWSGLRSSADGKRDGYPILVIGGDHGDLKLDPEPGAGTRLAEAIVAERFSCVICTDGLDDTRAIRYAREVLETIYRKNREPIHVFFDEADILAPQQPKEEEDNRCIRAMSHIVRRGRKKGIGTTLITQRPAELNASVRTMIEMLFVLGMLHNLDIDAVEKWLRLRKKKRGGNVAFALQEEMIESLDTLQCGDAWVWAPRLGIHKRFRARAKRTFDSGATPKPGQKVRAAKRLAPVDIARLGAAIAEAAQRLKDNDPKELKKQVTDLRRELERVSKAKEQIAFQLATKIKEKIVVVKHVEVVKPVDLRRLEGLAKKIDKLAERLNGTSADLERHFSELRDEAGKLAETVVRVVEQSNNMLIGETIALKKPPRPTASPAPAPYTTSTLRDNFGSPGDAPSRDLKPVHLRLLTAIAWWESVGVSAPDLGGVAFAAKTSTKSSAFDNTRSHLRARGYIDYPTSGRVQLTPAGRAVAPPSDLPPTNEALQGAILGKIAPAHGRMLRSLIEVYPEELSLEDFAKRAGTSTTSSAFDNNRSWLRARGLAEYPRTGFVRATRLLFRRRREQQRRQRTVGGSCG